MFFFFQAEDGIRDLVRSRGLGDVYKRQSGACTPGPGATYFATGPPSPCPTTMTSTTATSGAVSYTHLTLPTSDLV